MIIPSKPETDKEKDLLAFGISVGIHYVFNEHVVEHSKGSNALKRLTTMSTDELVRDALTKLAKDMRDGRDKARCSEKCEHPS